MKALFFSMAFAVGVMLFSTDFKGNSEYVFEAGRAAAARISSIIH